MIPLYVLAYCRVVLGITFAISATGKARDLSQFAQTVRTFQLLPEKLSAPAALIFLSGEFVIVVCMLLGNIFLVFGFGLAIALLTLFCFALATVLYRKIQTFCNCFGTTTRKISGSDIARNLGFILFALTGCVMLNWTQSLHSDLNLGEWLLIFLSAGALVLIWTQLKEILYLFRQA